MVPQALPIAPGEDHVTAFVRAGWRLARIQGSHHILVKAGCATLSVPCKKGHDLPRGTLRRLVRDAGLDEDQYLDFFRGRKR